MSEIPFEYLSQSSSRQACILTTVYKAEHHITETNYLTIKKSKTQLRWKNTLATTKMGSIFACSFQRKQLAGFRAQRRVVIQSRFVYSAV